jgi:hypothetical protein
MIAFMAAWLIAGMLIGSVAFLVDAWHLEGLAALQDAAIAATSATVLLIVGRVWGPSLRASDEDPLGDWIVASLAHAPGHLVLGSILVSATLWTGWSMGRQ